jgi:hypothetical protein
VALLFVVRLAMVIEAPGYLTREPPTTRHLMKTISPKPYNPRAPALLMPMGLLVCDRLHSVEQNHFYVMMLIIQGCCFIQSLRFSYELQEDCKIQNSIVQFPCIHPEDVKFRLDTHLLKYHPSGRRELLVQTSLCVQKL